MIELEAYNSDLKISLYPEDIRAIREYYYNKKRTRKCTQILHYDFWTSIKGDYNSIKELINLKRNQVGYK